MPKKTRVSRAEAVASSERLRRAILGVLPSARIEFTGSIRREDPEVGDIDLIYEGELSDLRSVPRLLWIQGGQSKGTMEWEGHQVDVWRVGPGEWGSMLFWTTGPTRYNIWYAKIAQYTGLKLSGHGLFDDNGTRVAGETEESVYATLHKAWKHPRERGKK